MMAVGDAPGAVGMLLVWGRLTNPNPIVCGVLAGVLAWGTYVSYYAIWFGLDHPPSATGDEPEYDTLGWELAHGRGFRVDYANSAFRRPYEQATAESELYRLTTTTRVGPIASRPPLLPFVMSLSDRLLGRQFWSVRLLNALCMATICGMLVTLTAGTMAERASTRDAPLTPGEVGNERETQRRQEPIWRMLPLVVVWVLFVVVDTRTRLYGRAILTEALAAVEVAGLCWLLFRFANRPLLRTAGVIGALLAAALLTRTQFVLWLPGVLAILFGLAIRKADDETTALGQRSQQNWHRLRDAALAGGVTVTAMLVVSLPWMVRNCLALGEFMPLGSQGWVQLSAAFGDAAWEHRGVWTNLESEGFFEGVVDPEMSLLEAEVALAHDSRGKALAWIAEHPVRTLALMPMKIAQELRPRTIPEGILLTLSVLGGLIAWQDLRTRILLALVLTCFVSIAATWSVEGRFLVPLLFVQHGLIALGLVHVCRGATDSARTPRPAT